MDNLVCLRFTTKAAQLGCASVSLALVVTMLQLAPAQAAGLEPAPATRTAAAPFAAMDPPDVDAEAVAAVAEGFESGSAESVAALAEAAATQDAVPVERTLHGLIAETDSGVVEVTRGGEASLSAEGLPEIGISVAGDPELVKLVDGSVVLTQVAPATDIVVRATEDSVQMIAILGDETAPNEVEFPLDLPEGAELVHQLDGSLTILADVVLEVPVPGELERFAAEVDRILDPDSGDDIELTGEQVAALEAVAPIRHTLVTERTAVAGIERPWAVDANGEPVDTHFVLDGDTLRQVIETDEATAFPVTADPNTGWWLAQKIIECTASVVAFAFPAAKLAKLAGQFLSNLRKAKGATTLVAAWERMGTTAGTRLTNLMSQMRTAISLIAQHGWKKGLDKLAAKGGKAKQTAILLAGGIGVVADVLGLRSCLSLFTGKD